MEIIKSVTIMVLKFFEEINGFKKDDKANKHCQ